MAIWRDRAKYQRVSEIVLSALGRYFVVNAADLPNLSISLSGDPPPPGIEHSLAPDVIAYERNAVPLQTFSDGIQVYVGLVAAVHSLP
jgi:hypothetical protein